MGRGVAVTVIIGGCVTVSLLNRFRWGLFLYQQGKRTQMSDYDPIEIRKEQMEGYYRRLMNQSPRDAYDSEYRMHLLHAAAIMTLADAIEYLANSHHDKDTDV